MVSHVKSSLHACVFFWSMIARAVWGAMTFLNCVGVDSLSTHDDDDKFLWR